MATPIYSIIIATYNRLEELRELTASVAKFTFPTERYEIIIADDGSTDGSREWLHAQTFPFTLRYLRQENQGPGAARNFGMREADGEYYIFIDSDCIIPSDYLNKVDEFLSKNKVDAFGGPDAAHPDFPPFLKAVNYSMTSFLGTGGTRGSTRSVTRFYPRSFNMGIHHKVFSDIGGMGGLRHGQDMDFSMRIYEAGYSVALIPDAFVYHKRRTSLWRFYKQIFNWGVARINLGRKYKEMLKAVHLLPAALLALAIVITVLAIFLPVIRPLFYLGVIGVIVLALTAFVQSWLQNRSIHVALLSIVTLFTQIIAYGLGTWSAIFQVARGKKVAEGITKNYYK